MNPEPRFVDAPAQPSERERKLHEVTHLPFKKWCSFCVMGKSRAILKYASDPKDIADRTHPTVQVDLFYQTAGNCLRLCVVMDISDAFLQVKQREFVVIEVPSWIRTILQQPNFMLWKLQRCLPGQRNAALEWNRHFAKLCTEFQFCSFQGGTLFKHAKEKQFLSVHIDDIILIAEEACHHLFVEHFSKKLKLKADGPYGVEKPGTLYSLKRSITFDNEGLEIAAKKKYVPKQSSLLGVQERRERGVPSNANLDVYDAEAAKEAQTFRSALGILNYLSQERLDIQHVTRILSSYMSRLEPHSPP